MKKASKQAGVEFHMPTLHMSQLIGRAAGPPESELKFKRHITPVGKKIMDATVR